MSSLQADDDIAAFYPTAAATTISACCFRAATHTAVFGSCDKLRGRIFNAGERLVYSTRLHWAVFLPLYFWLAVAFGLFVTKNATGITVGAILLIFAVIPLAITSLIARATSEFAVTNKRVLIKTGWIRRHSLETLLTKIESIRVEQSVLGRMLDYGTIIISGTGGSKEPFHKIAEPMIFRRRVQDQISVSEQLRNA
jgi:membrane protein YdbS with pleckstrin-like domain